MVATGGGNPPAEGSTPQQRFTQKFTAKEKRDQVVKQNDFQRKAQGHDNVEPDEGLEQPGRQASATRSMTNYPNSNLQMMEKTWGSEPFSTDALEREGDLDVEAEKRRGTEFQKLWVELMKAGDPTPMATAAQLVLDNDKSI